MCVCVLVREIVLVCSLSGEQVFPPGYSKRYSNCEYLVVCVPLVVTAKDEQLSMVYTGGDGGLYVPPVQRDGALKTGQTTYRAPTQTLSHRHTTS